MKAKLNDAWVDFRGKRVFTGNTLDLSDAVKTMQQKANQLQQDYDSLSHALAPTSASKPSLAKYYTKNDAGYAAQGGCTDGTYLYFYIRSSGYTAAGTLVKLRLSDYSTVKTAAVSLYHGNDLTYNPDTGLLYVATMYESGDTSRIDIIDPDTLTKLGSKYVPMYISAIAYEPSRHLFVGAQGGTLRKHLLKLDENGDFNHIGDIPYSESPTYEAGEYTSQSIACDEAYIYHLWTAKPQIRIEVFSWGGDYVSTLAQNVPYYSGVSPEMEFIDKLDSNHFIAGAYVSGYGSGAHIYTFTTS